MKTKLKPHKLLSMLLALVMVVGLLPAMSLTASAATGTGTEADPYIVTDYDELRDLMMNTPNNTIRYIKLGSDISYSESVNDHTLGLSNQFQSVVLDLNGYTISRSGKTTDTGVVYLTIGKLTIRDSSSTGTGKITSSVTAGETQATLVNSSNSSLIIEGGTFEVNAGNYATVIYTLGGVTEIYGGTFINNTSTGSAASFIYGTVYVDGGTFIRNIENSESHGLYIYYDSSGAGATVYLYNCTVIGGRLVLNGTAIPDGCSRSDTTIDGKSAVVIQAEDGVGVIKSLSATVEKPLEGATPATVAVAGDSRYTATIEQWYKGGTADHPGSEISTDHTFEGGETYVVEVRFTSVSGEFFRSDISAAINGAEGFHGGSSPNGTSLHFRVAFKVPADIKKVVMTSDISTPGIGWAATTPTFTVTEGNPVETRNATWQKYDDTTSTWNDYSGTTFEEGKYRCRVTLWLRTAAIENYLMSSDVSATVNGVSWEVDNKITWDGTNKLTRCTAYSQEYTAVKKYKVSFDANGGTGTMEDDIVSTGAARFYTLPENGFTAPAGKYFKGWAISPNSTRVGSPSTNYPITRDTTLYAIWGDITYIDTVDVTIPVPVAGESPQNGVSNTEGVTVTLTTWNSPSFEAGKVYTVIVRVNVDSGYAFADNVTLTFNGSKEGIPAGSGNGLLIYFAEFITPAASTEYSITVTDGKATVGLVTEITKAAEGTTVTLTANKAPDGKVFDKWEVVSGSITLADATSETTTFTMPAGEVSVKATYANVIETANCTVTVPIGGATPDFNPVSSDSSKYTVKLDLWYLNKSPYPHLGSTDVFAAGKEYTLRVIFTANEGYSFGDKTVFTINGEATLSYGIVGYRQIKFTAPVGYDITVTGGKATDGAGTEITKAAEGTTVTLTANKALDGKVFDKWEVVSGSITLADATSETTTFTMPAGAVSVKSTYKESHTHSYADVWSKDASKHWKSCACGEKKEEAAHTAGEWIVDQEATETAVGSKHKECSVCGYKLETAEIPATGKQEEPAPVPAAKGKVIKDKLGSSYKVTKSDAKDGTVTFTKPKSSVKGTVKVPDTVTIDGIAYKVNAIEANAFKNNKKITKVTIGKNVTVIGKNAFSGCAKLKTVKLGAAITTIGDKAFYKCTSLTGITIPAKVTKIGTSAFEGCKKLKTITVKTTKLKSVGKKALKGIYAKAKIKVPKSKLTKYKSLFKNKGQSKNVKVTK